MSQRVHVHLIITMVCFIRKKDMAEADRTYVRSNRRFCPHCSQFVVLKTYRSHKRLYLSEVRILYTGNPGTMDGMTPPSMEMTSWPVLSLAVHPSLMFVREE